MSLSRITHSTLNRSVKAAQYAVRGAIVQRSMELSEKLRQKDPTLPFNKIISCNIGNPQSLEQAPLTYIRDVLSIAVNPSLKTRAVFPKDLLSRAENYLSGIPSVGAYSESQGIFSVRKEISEFLTERDGFPADPADIFVTNGASEGVRLCMQTIMRSGPGFKDGVLTPIPQYPLYSALITLLDGSFVPYYLDESEGWNCEVEQLSESLRQATSQGITTRALVVINPGNPTGQVLSEAAMRNIVTWCRDNEICLMADEVYQENIWKPSARFVSFRKVAKQLDAFSGEKPLQLISFHSISKGFLGECGLRGGYFELQGIPAEVKQEIYKLASISLCSNTIGQIATGLMVRPPKAGEESFPLYNQEKNAILDSLRRRSTTLSQALNSLEGVSCTSIDGAMYAFPTITLPAKAIDAAKAAGIEADAFYCMQLLEATGIVVVPGSGFGQRPGTYHFRTTILPPEDKITDVIRLLSAFHSDFLRRYSS